MEGRHRPGTDRYDPQYRLLAGGSVLEERVFAGTPQEMVTMFYDRDGKLALTHYCMMGNRPAMTLKTADAKALTFDFDGAACCIQPSKESHMHALTLRFDDADTIMHYLDIWHQRPEREWGVLKIVRLAAVDWSVLI